jgi:hypothetical protein
LPGGFGGVRYLCDRQRPNAGERGRKGRGSNGKAWAAHDQLGPYGLFGLGAASWYAAFKAEPNVGSSTASKLQQVAPRAPNRLEPD